MPPFSPGLRKVRCYDPPQGRRWIPSWVRIPNARILSVRWEPLPNDIANHRVVVRFANDEGTADGVAFRDVDAWPER